MDSDTLSRWERREREPIGKLLLRAERFLEEDENQGTDLRRAGYA